MSRLTARLSFATLLLPIALLIGCGIGSNTSPSTTQISLRGSIHGGQQPIIGSTLQLYTVGTTGNASAATPLITGNAVTTDANGNFNITGDYSCASATQVYLVATGGDSGSGSNSALALAAPLGSCTALQTNLPFVTINELTTVAAAYTLAPFESGSYLNIGSSNNPTLTTGLANAMGTANLLVDPTAGVLSATRPTGITIPSAEINTLADILAACVNSNGAATPAANGNPATPCYNLFNVTGASNTLDAAFYIAKKPGSSAVTGLFSLVSGTAPFQPTLSAAPADFTIAVKYTGNEIKTPYGIAIDQYGNAFVTNNTGNSVTAAPPLSTTFATSTNTATNTGGLNGPQAISIGTDGYVWISNHSGNNVVEIAPLNSSPVSTWNSVNSRVVASVNVPYGIVNDNAGNGYVVGNGYITSISGASGAATATLATSSLANANSVAINNTGIITFTNDTSQLCTLPTYFTASSTPTCAATGSSTVYFTNLVATNQGSGANVGYAANNGTYGPSSTTGPYSGGGQTSPAAIAFDGAGNAFIGDNVSSTFNPITGFTTIPANIAELNGSTAISPSQGFASVTLGSNSPQGIAIDPSGNVWLTETNNSLVVLVGLAAPTVTPIAEITVMPPL